MENCQWCQRIARENPKMLPLFTPAQLHEGHEVVDEHLAFFRSSMGQQVKYWRRPAKPRRKGRV